MRVFKRLGASAVTLGLLATGIVISAPAASAHANAVTGVSSCQQDGTYKVDWTIKNDYQLTETVTEISHTGGTLTGLPADVVKLGTTSAVSSGIPGSATQASLKVKGVWSDQATHEAFAEVRLDGTCGDNDTTKKVELCHYDTAAQSWSLLNDVPVSAVIGTGGHDADAKDVIPSFSYVKNGQTQTYAGKNWDTTGQSFLEHGCKAPVKNPSGDLATDCVDGGGKVTASVLDSGTFGEGVQWRLVSGDAGAHTTVVGTLLDGSLVATGLPDSTTVWLQYQVGTGGWNDEGSFIKTTENCTPPTPVNPKGSFTTACTETDATVTIGTLTSGTAEGVVWTLQYGTVSKTVAEGDVVPVGASVALALAYKIGAQTPTVVQSGTAPAACPEVGEVVKTSVPATGTVVALGQTIAYTVTVKNTGQVPITNAPVVDTLPGFVTAVSSSVSDSGVVSTDGRTINWTVSLAAGVTKTLTYSGLVATNAPAGTSLVNKASFLLHESTTTHPVGAQSLAIEKAVTPLGAAKFGDPLTYTMKVTAGGDLGQTNVVVTDYLPGYEPGRASGKTTYVSAGCDVGTCVATYDDAAKKVTWELGSMAPGAVRTVTFKVTIDTPEVVDDEEIGAVDIVNSAVVASNETPGTPSNEVITPVDVTTPETAVEGTKIGPEEQPPTTTTQAAPLPNALPHTGAGLPVGWTLGAAAMFLLMGGALLFIGRKTPVRLPRG